MRSARLLVGRAPFLAGCPLVLVGCALVLVGCPLVLVGCAPGAPMPTASEEIPEVVATGEELAGWAVEEGWARSPSLALPLTRIGALLVLRGPGAHPILEGRGIAADGTHGPWTRLETTFEDADQRVARVELGFVAARAELRLRAEDVPRVAVLTWSALVPPPPIGEAPRAAGVAIAPLRDDLRALGVRDRASWGARATRCTDADPSKYRIAIHHTVTPSGGDIGARLRGIQAFHMDTNGWCDVGYHFLVTLDGTLWEGRDLGLLGTHVGGGNTGNVGISFIGCFHTSGCNDWTPFVPPDVMVDAGGRLAGAIAGIYGIAVSPDTLKGHRDHAGATTSCPGDHLHARLDRIREVASGGAAGPRFRGVYVSQSFPLARDPFALTAGETAAGYIELRNEGSEPWTPGATFLGTTEPRDVASPLAAPDWVSPNRPATVDRVVAPGEVGRFAFSVRAPDAPGDYPQFFSLVQEGVAWFSDPGQGGPPDDQLQVRVTSLPASDAGGSDAGPPRSDAGPPDAGAAMSRGGDPGCGCRAGAPRSPPGVLVALALALGLLGRRARGPDRAARAAIRAPRRT
jgi:hypothetical protein